MRIERWIILLLGMALVQAWWKPVRRRMRRWWQRTKEQLPRHWHPKSPKDCPLCQAEAVRITEPVVDLPAVEPYQETKSQRGRKKTILTEGYACPYPDCRYFGVTEAERHALVGFGKLGENKDIQRLRCQACGGMFSSRKGTPLYYIKSEEKEFAEVLWWLAEGVDLSVLVRKTGHCESTLTTWLNRMGEHSARWHERLFQNLSITLIQMDELYAKVRGVEDARWLWLAIDPKCKALLALHLGLRRSDNGYTLVHKLKRCLHPGCVPAFTTDGLRSYFYAVTAHFGRWFRPPRARTDHWQVDERLLQGQLVKRHERRKLTYTITRMLWGKRQALNDLLEDQGFRRLIQTAYIERVNLTIRQGVSLLTRRTWSLPQTEHHLLYHVEWWRCYYHFIRPHEALRETVSGEKRRYRPRTPAMTLGLTDHVWTAGEILRKPLVAGLAA